MLGTTTQTQTDIRLQMVSLEMQSINDRTVKDPLLQEIIAYCVPRKYLESYTIYGMDGDQAHMRLDVKIDYEEHEEQLKFSGDGLSGGLAGDFADVPTSNGGQVPGQVRYCPHVATAVSLYVRLAREKGLRLHWAVRFREKRAEMCEKFGLGPAIIRDATTGGSANRVISSEHPELSVAGRVSTQIVPAK